MGCLQVLHSLCCGYALGLGCDTIDMGLFYSKESNSQLNSYANARYLSDPYNDNLRQVIYLHVEV